MQNGNDCIRCVTVFHCSIGSVWIWWLKLMWCSIRAHTLDGCACIRNVHVVCYACDLVLFCLYVWEYYYSKQKRKRKNEARHRHEHLCASLQTKPPMNDECKPLNRTLALQQCMCALSALRIQPNNERKKWRHSHIICFFFCFFFFKFLVACIACARALCCHIENLQ